MQPVAKGRGSSDDEDRPSKRLSGPELKAAGKSVRGFGMRKSKVAGGVQVKIRSRNGKKQTGEDDRERGTRIM
jgi:hypothetical protein